MISAADPRQPVRRALISVYDKTDLGPLATVLHAQGIELLASGGTQSALRELGLPVVGIEQVTGVPELLDGRVKTLHPAIHAALLADRSRQTHMGQLEQAGIEPIDLVVVNLYPFVDTVRSSSSPEQVIEQIDIGGVALLRAAAKNSIAVLFAPEQYPMAIEAIAAGGFTGHERSQLAARAFAHVAHYDVAIAEWMSERHDRSESGWPRFRGGAWALGSELRYGENPHQPAALYRDLLHEKERALATALVVQGKAMSYNNYQDAQAALDAIVGFEQPAVAIIKHANPCGIATGPSIEAAHAAAFASDSISAYGGVIAVNRPLTRALAKQIASTFTEVLIAPACDADALEILRAKPALRILLVNPDSSYPLVRREIDGGVLVQERDRDLGEEWTLACGAALDGQRWDDLRFAWQAVRSVKSNAILIARGEASVGIGMGQVNRVDAARLAVARAGDRAVGAVAASDAFFPFPDGVQVLADAGVIAIVQPGGSVRDEEVIAAARAAGITMYLTGVRHFWH